MYILSSSLLTRHDQTITHAHSQWFRVATAPPGTQAAQFDIDAAYRRIATVFNHWKFLVVSLPNHKTGLPEYFIDMAHPFGLKSAGGNLGYAMDATIAILQHSLLIPFIAKWVDDLVTLRYPSRTKDDHFEYDVTFDEICSVFHTLGWPLSTDKIRDFSPRVRYIGFDWDFPSRTVILPEEKRLKFLNRLSIWTQAASSHSGVSAYDTEKLIGSLNHISNIFPHARSALPSLHAFLASFRSDSRFVTIRASHAAIADARLWHELLSIPNAFRHLEIRAHINLDIWVDASTDWGIALIVGKSWRAWKLRPGWKANRRDIGWAESAAIEIATLYIASLRVRHKSFLIHSDNQGSIGQYEKGRSRNVESNLCIRRATVVMMQGAFDIAPAYVPSADNRADAASRGLNLLEATRLRSRFAIPSELAIWLNEA